MSSRVSPGQEFALGLAGRKEFENELDGQARPSDHRFAGQDPGIDDDALRQRHDLSLSHISLRASPALPHYYR
jgi:hypothetical protein